MLRLYKHIMFRLRHRLRLKLLSIGRFLLDIRDQILWLFALTRSPWQTTEVWPEQPPAFTGMVAIFAHYDPLEAVGDYVIAHLAELKSAGFQIIFVSNAEHLEEKYLQRLKIHCDAILLRRNMGGRWSAWREGLNYLGQTPISRLLLVDDSQYGPLRPLTEVLAELNSEQVDVWGLTENWRPKWHLQPYFLLIHPRLLENKAWQKFWNSIVPVWSERWQFRKGDVGFSQSMLDAGARMRSRSTAQELMELIDRSPLQHDEPGGIRPRFRFLLLHKLEIILLNQWPINPPQLLWRQLLHSGHPYLSRLLMRKNPDQAHDIFDWTDELDALPGADITLIERDLHMVGKERHQKIENWLKPLKQIGKPLLAAARGARDGFSLLLSLPRSPFQARYVWPDEPVDVGERVIIFVHFDKKGEVRDYVLQYLAALVAAEVSVVFVSNSGKLKPKALEKLKPLCKAIIVRRNIGYDFGAWREGLEYLKGSLDQLHWLAIGNDSIYGPISPLGPVLARMDFSYIDIWGMTDSEQRNYHMQSYFIAFSRRVLRSKAWHKFWKGVRPVKSKHWAIASGELKLTTMLQKAGFQARALWPYRELIETVDKVKRLSVKTDTPFAELRLRQRHNLTALLNDDLALNPTSDLWRQLLRAGFPFIKRELLRSNPSGVPDTLDWKTEVTNTPSADVQLIEEDLRKSVIGRMA